MIVAIREREELQKERELVKKERDEARRERENAMQMQMQLDLERAVLMRTAMAEASALKVGKQTRQAQGRVVTCVQARYDWLNVCKHAY